MSARCPTCDREGCGWFDGCGCDGTGTCRAFANCRVHAVDWRARCLAAEAAKAEADRRANKNAAAAVGVGERLADADAENAALRALLGQFGLIPNAPLDLLTAGTATLVQDHADALRSRQEFYRGQAEAEARLAAIEEAAEAALLDLEGTSVDAAVVWPRVTANRVRTIAARLRAALPPATSGGEKS